MSILGNIGEVNEDLGRISTVVLRGLLSAQNSHQSWVSRQELIDMSRASLPSFKQAIDILSLHKLIEENTLNEFQITPHGKAELIIIERRQTTDDSMK